MSIFDLFKKIERPAATGPVEYIIAGLGNPGAKYEDTRHNVGFMCVDILAKRMNASMRQIRFKSLCGDGMLGGVRCLLLKPSTYMNKSGEAIVEAMQFYKVPIERVIVLTDDISLDVGRLRIRRKGSDGGHNGLKNIIYLSGKNSFPRVRIGVGAKPHPDFDLADWVLSRFAKEEGEQLTPALENAATAIELIVGERMDEAMNRFN